MDERRTGRRASAADRAVTAVRFSWNTSRAPWLAGLRHWAGGELPARVRWVRSRTEPGRAEIAYAGLREGLTYVLPFLEERRGGSRVVRDSGTVRWRSLLRSAPGVRADLLAVGCTTRRARRLPDRAAVLLPFRVHLELPISADPQARARQVSRKDRQHFARQRRRLDWAAELGTDRADFDDFYDRFHLPTMRSRHGDATRSLDRSTAFECVFRRGVLLFVTEHGERVAGLLCRIDDRSRMTLRLAGVRDGAAEHYRSGVFMAGYLLLQEWAAGAGVERLDLSGCEPFLSKGIFQFKRKLHPEVVRPDNHFRDKRLWLGALRDTPGVRDFLVANPMVAEAGDGRFVATYFYDESREPCLGYRWQTPGIAGSRLVDLDAFLAGVPVAAASRPVPGEA